MFFSAIVVGIATGNDRVHNIVAPFMPVFFVTYVATLFVQLN